MAMNRKILAGLTVVSLAALAVAGTFAWTNFNSQALNEWMGSGVGLGAAGPGGTLHDYHEENGEDKQIFVENWGNENLFVRIRLQEYMELGSGAGLKALNQNASEIVHNPLNLAEPLIPGTNIDDLDTWIPHTPAGSEVNDCGLEFHDFWSWEMGGQIYYFPAPEGYRENKSFVFQTSPAGLTADSVNNEGVQARQTRFAEVLTMAQWIDNGSTIGDYWVIDTDGWAYWAAPLTPGDATGLLINRVTRIAQPEKDYFYGINVVAQMATKDLDDFDNFERFGDIEHGGWTNNGMALMTIITGSEITTPPPQGNIVHVEPVRYVEDGLTKIAVNPPLLNGVIYVKQGQSLNASGANIHWIHDRMSFGLSRTHPDIQMGHANTGSNPHFFNIGASVPVGFRSVLSGRRHINVNLTNVETELGPIVTVPFVIIPAESEGVVFGRSGSAYVYFGNNQYQELIEGANPDDDMTLGPMIGIEEIE